MGEHFLSPMSRPFILIAHHGKAEQSSSQHKTLGSVALVNTPRAVWQIYRDKTDKNLRYFTPSKTNDCVDPTTVAFRIVQPGQVQIENTSVNKTADDFMMAERQQFTPGPPPEERRKCENRLSEILAEGEKPQLDIMEVLLEEGFSEATIQRAKKTLGVKNRRDGFQGASYWHLPLISTPPHTFQVQPEMYDSPQTFQDTDFIQNTENIGT